MMKNRMKTCALILGFLFVLIGVVAAFSNMEVANQKYVAEHGIYKKGDFVHIRVDGRRGLVTEVCSGHVHVCYPSSHAISAYSNAKFKDFELEPWTEPPEQQK